MKLESRLFPASELRVESGDTTARIVGYAIVFDSPSEIINEWGFRFREIIKRSAVDVPLAPGADVRALVDHDSAKLLGRTKPGTLRYTINKKGVRVEIDPPDTSYAKDVVESIRRGDLDGMSFRFAMPPSGGEEWDDSGDIPIRTIKQMTRIPEFSVVTFPAYPETEAAVRSLEEYKKSKEPQRPALTLAAAARRIRLAEAGLTLTTPRDK